MEYYRKKVKKRPTSTCVRKLPIYLSRSRSGAHYNQRLRRAPIQDILHRRSNGPVRMRILAIEDHRDSLEAIYRLLVFHHHDVTPARTLKDAVRLCIKDKFDLVICDIG